MHLKELTVGKGVSGQIKLAPKQAQSGRTQADKHLPKLTRPSARPSRFQALYLPTILIGNERVTNWGSGTCGGALKALLVLVGVWIACPLPDCACFGESLICLLTPFPTANSVTALSIVNC